MVHHKKPNRIVVAMVAMRNFCTIAKAGITDVIAILSLLGVGINMVWCMEHGKEIEKIKRAQETQVQQQKPAKPFVPAVIAHKFNFF